MARPASCLRSYFARMVPRMLVALSDISEPQLTMLQLTIASKAGPKLDLAKRMDLADAYITISDTAAQHDMSALLHGNPQGFDIVVEATGAPSVLEQSIHYVRKGGTLVVYGVYDDAAKISWPPMLIWKNELTILASFCSTLKLPVVMEYLRAKRLNFNGIVDRTFRIEEWAEALQAVERQEVVKAAIVFD